MLNDTYGPGAQFCGENTYEPTYFNFQAAFAEDTYYGYSVECPVTGCMDSSAFNYNAEAITDDGSCEAVVTGCMDSSAFNYNAEANTDDGSCEAVVTGCMDSSAVNYNAEANTD